MKVTDSDKKTPMRKGPQVKADDTQPTETPQVSDSTQMLEMEAEMSEVLELERSTHADRIVRRNIYWALGFGVAPLPIADMLTIGAVQLKMMKELADLYDVPFSKNLAIAAAAGIVGGIGPVELAKGLSASVVKLIPGAGSVAGIAALPISAGALTYVIGHVLIKHFESEGTFLNLDMSKVKGYSKDLYQKGKGLVGRMKKEKDEAVAQEATSNAATEGATPAPA